MYSDSGLFGILAYVYFSTSSKLIIYSLSFYNISLLSFSFLFNLWIS